MSRQHRRRRQHVTPARRDYEVCTSIARGNCSHIQDTKCGQISKSTTFNHWQDACRAYADIQTTHGLILRFLTYGGNMLHQPGKLGEEAVHWVGCGTQ